MNDTVSTHPVILSSARWFWWIAGLSLVNLALFYGGSNTSFVIGLAMASFASAMFAEQVVIGLSLSALIIGFYFAMGYFAQREKAWAFYVGLGLYAIDALIYAKFDDWMPVAFHAYAMFCIAKGLMALGEAKAIVPAQPQAEVVEPGQ